MNRFFKILWDLAAAPFRVILDPWGAMHGQVGGALAQLSIAAIAGLLTLLFMTLISIVFVVVVILNMPAVDAAEYWWRLLVLVGIILATSVVVYYMVRFWTQEGGERFPDIEQAWKKGLAEVERLGLDLQHIPLYLVLGSESSVKDQELFAASELKFLTSHFPKGRGVPLRWYASEEAVFVVLSHVGSLSSIGRAAGQQTTDSRVLVPIQGPTSMVSVSATCWPTEDESAAWMEDSGIRMPKGAAAAAAPVSNQVGSYGTLQSDDGGESPGAPEAPGGRRRPPQLPAPNRETTNLELRKLEFLCSLVMASRRPFCPVNGVLVQLPLNLILADTDGVYSKEAVRSDLAVLVNRLGVRFPAVVLVTGWDEDLGFQEFIRRLGVERARQNRFGKGFGVGDPPLKDQLGALCINACRAFEDWIYKLFREPNTLSKAGNRALYSLLCKVRRYLYPRLDRIVAEGMGCDEPATQVALPYAGGCYFAAASPHEDIQAFVSKVFIRLIETNEDLEWTPQAEAADARYYFFGYASLILAMLLIAAIPLLLWFGPGAAG